MVEVIHAIDINKNSEEYIDGNIENEPWWKDNPYQDKILNVNIQNIKTTVSSQVMNLDPFIKFVNKKRISIPL